MSERIPEQVLTPLELGGGHMATVAGWMLAKECPKCKNQSEEVLHLFLEPLNQWPNQVVVHRGCNAHWFLGQVPPYGVNWVSN